MVKFLIVGLPVILVYLLIGVYMQRGQQVKVTTIFKVIGWPFLLADKAVLPEKKDNKPNA